MKNLYHYIFEKFIINKNTKNNENDPNNPNYWQIGAILCGTWSFDNKFPIFFKIIKKSNNTFTLARIEGKIISGDYSKWEEEPDMTKDLGKEIKVRINQKNKLVINDVTLGLWDGKPLTGIRK